MSEEKDPTNKPAKAPTFTGSVTGSVFNFGTQQGVVSTGDHASIHQNASPLLEANAAADLWKRRDNLKDWAHGAETLTLAIAFTDVVDSTHLGNELGDHTWNQIRRRHMDRCEAEVKIHAGYFIKNLGDGILAAFHDSASGLDTLLALIADTGHPQIRLRAGLHLGEVSLENEDTFGSQVNFAARVMAHAIRGGLRVSDPAHSALTALRLPRHDALQWTAFEGVTLKGFEDTTRLWAVSR